MLRVKETKPITSMAEMIITSYIILHHESFLRMGNLASTTVISSLKRKLMVGRLSTDSAINFLVLLFFRAVTFSKSPYLPEPQLPHLKDGYDND